MLTIKLPEEQWNVVLGALGQAPYITAAPIIAQINAQALPQIQKAARKMAALPGR